MVRTTNSVPSHRRKKRLRKLAKGFVGDRKNHLRLTGDTVMKALSYKYVHRKHKKRDYRSLWITRIGVAAKINGMSYSKFMHGLKKAGCELNRKLLADLAVRDPGSFASVVGQAKTALA
jgi:large subunit ribosomal protein L20